MTTITETTATVETVSETPSNDVTVESKPKRTRDEASLDRIEYHLDVSREKRERLAALEAAGRQDKPEYKKCVQSLEKNEAFIAELRSKMQARAEKRAAKATTKAA